MGITGIAKIHYAKSTATGKASSKKECGGKELCGADGQCQKYADVGRILRTFKIKKECGGNRQWQRRFLRNWAANTTGKAIT